MANKLITSTMLEENKLQHHGIKGMKWGVRRTQEQLGYKAKSAGAKSEATMGDLTTFLAFVAVSYIVSNVGNKKATEQAEDPELQLKKLKDANKIKPPETYSDSIRGTNDTRSLNKNYKNNCPNTTLAYELRRRGYDVKAKPAPKGLTMSTIRDLYNIKDSDINITNMNNPLKTKENNKKIKDYFDSMPDGYRGAIGIRWDSVIPAGHIFNVEKIDGKTVFIDSQVAKSGTFKGASLLVKTSEEIKGMASYGLLKTNPANYLSKAATVEIFRTDNAVINETTIKDRLLKG